MGNTKTVRTIEMRLR